MFEICGIIGYMEQFHSERQRPPREKLRAFVADVAKEINGTVEGEYGLGELLDTRGMIRMEGFGEAPGFSDARIEHDKKEIYEREVEWSGARDPRIREFYRERYGAETEEEIVRIHGENKEREKNGQMEMFVAALFHKILKGDFIVARASAYDDYNHGIDTVMVNVKTGDIVCAFDEVHDHKASDRAAEKEEKIKRKARQGGSMLSYGIAMEGGKLVRREVKDLPVFFLGLSTADLEAALANMSFGSGASEKEREIFTVFLASLEDQRTTLLAERVPKPVRDALVRFETSLEMMKARAQKK